MTSGAQAQLRYLEDQRAELAKQQAIRDEWLEENLDLLGRYSAISDELHHRANARRASYSLAPPDDLLAAIGARPDEGLRMRQWDEIARLHAHARLELGPTVDLLDPSLDSHLLYRYSVTDFTQPSLSRGSPVRALRPAG